MNEGKTLTLSKIKNKIIILSAFLFFWILIYANLKEISEIIVVDVFGIDGGTNFKEALLFFVFEVPKVMLLLTLIVFVVGIVRTYFSPEKTRKILGGKSLFKGNVMASTLGIVTPFCSCSAIPLFIGFVQAGVPLGVTFSFLIAAPMINEIAVVLLFGLFGWQTTLLYISTGLIIAITAGYIIGRLNLENYIEDWVRNLTAGEMNIEEQTQSFESRIESGITAVKEIVGKIWIYILVGIAVGAGIHGYVPENFMAGIMGKSAWWSVPISVLIGVPMYSNAAGIIPIVQALLGKGAALGTVLAFMMSVIGLSLPEMIILRKVLKLPLLVTFAMIVAVGIILVGFAFNIIY